MCLITQHRCNYSFPFKSIIYTDWNGSFAICLIYTVYIYKLYIYIFARQNSFSMSTLLNYTCNTYLMEVTHPSPIQQLAVFQLKKTLLLSLHCLYNAEWAQKYAHCSSFFYLGTKIRTKKYRDVTNSHESLATWLWQHDMQVVIPTRPLFCPSHKHTLLQQQNKKMLFFDILSLHYIKPAYDLQWLLNILPYNSTNSMVNRFWNY